MLPASAKMPWRGVVPAPLRSIFDAPMALASATRSLLTTWSRSDVTMSMMWKMRVMPMLFAWMTATASLAVALVGRYFATGGGMQRVHASGEPSSLAHHQPCRAETEENSSSWTLHSSRTSFTARGRTSAIRS
jgi:hypothetical protein